MDDASRRQKRFHKSWLGVVLIYPIHLAVATVGVLLVADILTSVVFEVVYRLGGTIAFTPNWILSGTPFFPVQIIVGMLLGAAVGRVSKNNVAIWVWVVPLAVLAAALTFISLWVTFPRPIEASFATRLSHFFGWGCQARLRCFDQLGITGPFYCSAAYSLGALIARSGARKHRPEPPLAGLGRSSA